MGSHIFIAYFIGSQSECECDAAVKQGQQLQNLCFCNPIVIHDSCRSGMAAEKCIRNNGKRGGKRQTRWLLLIWIL